MNDTKEKIRAMLKEESLSKRREELEEKRGKQSGKKAKKNKQQKEKKQHPSLSSEKKKLVRNLFFVFLFLILSLGLFYGAAISKQSVEDDFHEQVEAKAKKALDVLMAQSLLTLSRKINNLNYILRDTEYIKNFNQSSWQSILKTELAALLGEQAVIEIVPEDFSDDDILDNPDMSYAVLTLLKELRAADNTRSANNLRIEVLRAKSENARLMMIRKVTFQDVELNKDKAIGYIIASLSPLFLEQLIKDFKAQSGYIEVVQKFAGRSTVLVKKGDSSLKNMPLVMADKLKNTQWIVKFWPAEQREEIPLTSFWQAIVYLALGSLGLVSALVLLGLVINQYRSELYVVLPGRRKKPLEKSIADTHDSKDIVSSKEITDVMFSDHSGIAVADDNLSESQYLQHVTDNIFKAYDIRGVVGDFIDAEIFREIAYAVAIEMNELKQSKIAIARDGRNSSPELQQALMDVLIECGLEVIDIGMVSSPILYFAALTKADGNGLIVTASHNPANYNGIKIMLTGHSYNQKRLQNLKQYILERKRPVIEKGSEAGKVVQLNVMEDYFSKITGNVILARPMNIVIDTANGVTGQFAATFFEQLGCRVTALNTEVDGNFPVHEPDPSRPENLSELIQKVAEVKADVGIAFDGDGDRLGLVSSGGEIIWPDRILMLLAKDILSRNEGATILYDVKSSGKLERFIRELGGNPVMCQSGHSLIKSKLLETGALLAGEMSGHIFIKERWFGFDDALFVAARVLEILSIDLRKSRQIFAELPDSLNTPEVLIAARNAHEVMARILADTSHFKDGKVITIDGLRVEYRDGWGLVRASNTTDNLTMRFEADNEEALQRIANKFKGAVLAAEPELNFPF